MPATREDLVRWATWLSIGAAVLLLAGTLYAAWVASWSITPDEWAAEGVPPMVVVLLFGLTATTFVVLGAIMFWRREEPLRRWGVAVTLAGMFSFLVTGGFVVGGVAAVAAGLMVVYATSTMS